MCNRLLLSIAVLSLLAAPSWAVPPEKDGAAEVYKMCNAEDVDGGNCDDGDGAIVLETTQLRSINFDFAQSTATTLDCDVRGNDTGNAAGNYTVLNSVSFSTSQYSIGFDGAFPRYLWVYCTTTTGGTATATATTWRK